MAGMAEVGRLFGNNELIVAEVLQSAEAMKAAVTHLERYMLKADAAARCAAARSDTALSSQPAQRPARRVHPHLRPRAAKNSRPFHQRRPGRRVHQTL